MELQVENLLLKYGNHTVLNQISFRLGSGHLYGMVGINGAGKTTLLNCISGLLNYASGSIQIDGHQLRTNDVSYLETKTFAYSHMTGRDYIELFSSHHPEFNTHLWNKLFELPLDEYVANYSSGMLKKLGILGLLAQDRQIILLDEPFNALDLEAVELIKRILPELKKKNKIILITSHILETLTTTCDYIIYLKDGKVFRYYEKADYSSLKGELTLHLDEKYEQGITDAFRE